MTRGRTLRDSRSRYAGSTRASGYAPTPKSVRTAQHAAWTAQSWLRTYKRRQRKVAAQKRQPAPPQVPISTEWIRPVVPQRPVPVPRPAATHADPRTVTIAGQEYLFTRAQPGDLNATGVIGSLWRDNSDDDEDDGHPVREWMAYVREDDKGRHLLGGVWYDVLDADKELAPLRDL